MIYYLIIYCDYELVIIVYKYLFKCSIYLLYIFSIFTKKIKS